MSDDSAAWNRLPHDPLGFFGLTPGFDRKDLKRSYGKLIRVYKPETHPQEFQRIREAYEELESQLRYGVQQASTSRQIDAWNIGGASDGKTKEKTKAAVSPAKSIVELALESPAKVYKQLSESTERSPQDYYVLAILCECLDSKDPQRFTKWILTGLKQFPDDPGLVRLLREHLMSDIEIANAQSILLTLSKIATAEIFYQVSEPLWDRLIREIPFTTFAKLLDACEAQFKHGTLHAKLVFYIHLLKSAVWRGDKDWVEKHWKFIEQHGVEIPVGFDQEVELLRLIQEYVQLDRSKASSSPTRMRMDEMIRSYCEDPFITATSKAALVLDEIARNSHGFMEAFSAEDFEVDHRILSLCAMIAMEIIEQTGLTYDEVYKERVSRQADQTVNDLRNDSEKVWARISNKRLLHFGIPFAAVVIAPIMLLWGWLDSNWMAIFAVSWLVIGSAFFFAVVKQFWLDASYSRKLQKIVTEEYASLWRPRLFRYVQSCHTTPQVAIEELRNSAYHLGDSQLVDVVLSYAAVDLGLRFFHLSQQFSH